MHRLGHSSAQAALRYQHATPERDRAIAEATPSSSKRLPAKESQGYPDHVADKVWTAKELEGMMPAERDAIFESSLVGSLDNVPPAFLARVRRRVQERIADADIREG